MNAHANLNAEISKNASRAVTLLNLATQAKNGGQARAIMALLLSLRAEVIRAEDVSHYLRSDNKKSKTEYMSRVLDDVFGFDHSAKEAPRKAETATRARISECLPVALYLHLVVPYPPAMMAHPKTGDMIPVPTEPRVEIEVIKPDTLGERCFLKVPGSVLFKPGDKRGEVHIGNPCLILDGSAGRTIDSLKTRARDYLFPADPTTGAQNGNSIREKRIKDVSAGDLISEVATEIRKMDAAAVKPIMERMQELHAEVRAKLPIGSGLDEDEGTLMVEIEDISSAVANFKAIKSPAILGRLAKLYDALDEAMKDDDFYAAAEAAKTA